MTENFNVFPYYDDFDESKQFVRIMYNPGLAVQARELTQQQTVIQNQIKRFGDHIFQDGSKITGGQIFYNNKVKFLAIEASYGGNPVAVAEWLGKVITGAVSGAEARVVHVNEAEAGDPPLFFLEMMSGDTISTSSEFVAGENVAVVAEGLAATVQAADFFGDASIFSINEGVYYIDGFFAFVNPQTIVLEKYSNTPSYRVGLTLVESIITSSQDASLLDPARNSPNFQGIGANRLKVELVLDKKSLAFTEDVDNSASAKFIELIRIEDGTTRSEVKYPIYSDIMRTMARRTYDESGDYTVRPFTLRVDMHPTDQTMLKVGVEPGKAFVKGFEFETISTEYLDIPKSRDTEIEQNREANAQIGNYVLVNDMVGVFDPTQIVQVTLHDLVSSAIGSGGVFASSQIGTAYLRAISYNSGTGSNLTYRFYLFDIQSDATHSIDDVASIWSGAYVSAISANIDPVEGQDVGKTILFSPNFNIGLLRAPYNAVKTLKPSGVLDTNYISCKKFAGASFAAGVASIAVSGDDTFFGGTGALTDTVKREQYLCVITSLTNAGATGYSVGDVVDFTGSRSITLSGGDQIASFDIDDATFVADMTILATVNLNVKPERIKTLTSTTVLGVTLAGDIGDLAISDVYDIVEIRDTGDSNAIVTDKFALDNGQRDNFYDHGSIVLNAGETVVGPLDADIRYFAHTGTGYFSVDSYVGLTLDQISTYIAASGIQYPLGDSIDFRPRRVDGGSTFTVAVTGSDFIRPDTNIDFDIEFYLSRYININILSDLRFSAQLGESAIYPKAPIALPNAMTIYQLRVPAFTATPATVYTTYVDNRRYTMRDIAAIAKRVDRIEYYTALSLMEKNTTDLLVADSGGNELFKNGILVDPFKDHSIGNYLNPDYKASIDTSRSRLRPPSIQQFYSLIFNSGESAGTTKTNDGITLDFTESVFVNQPLASKSMSLNPFSVAAWQGNLIIAPQTDQWVDTQTKPEFVDAGSAGNTIPQVADWPQGMFDWFTTNNGFGARNIVGGKAVQPLLEQYNALNLGTSTWFGNTNFYNVDTNASSVDKSLNTRLGSISAAQVQTSIGLGFLYDQIVQLAKTPTTVIEKSVGTRVTDINFIPFIRAQTITWTITGMKPKTRVYPFFDGVSVSVYVTPTGGSMGGAIYTDAAGKSSGSFSLPNTSTLRFRTGQRDFKLTDSAVNDDITATCTSVAHFFAQGLLQTKEGNVESTRPVDTKSSSPNNNLVVTDPVTRDLSNGGRTTTDNISDPVAQIFTVDNKVYPNGLYATSIDLFFETKDANLPVAIELRPTVNGFPHSSVVIPFSHVSLEPAAVSVSDDATIPTKFSFRVPVYLTGGEYAVLLITNTENYKCFVAELGANVIGTNQRIVAQPYTGALFKSQNATIWQPDLTEDLTFKMYYAIYATNTSKTSVLEAVPPPIDFEYDSFIITNDSLQPPGGAYQLHYKRRQFPSGVFDADWTPVNDKVIENLSSRAFLDSTDPEPSFKIRATMSTTDAAVSPMIDEERTNLILFQNIINNDSTDEDLATGGNADAKYISRKVVLRDGFDATGLKVYLNACLRAGTTLLVYAKALSKDDPTAFEDRPWVLIPRTGDTAAISANDDHIIELEYENFDLSYDGYADFKTWAIKIVMLSPSTTVIPTVRDMRAIAVS